MVESLFKRLERVTSQWDEEVNKIFLEQLEEVSREQTLVPVQDFNLPDIYRKGSNPGGMWRVLGMTSNVVARRAIRGAASLNLILAGKAGDVITSGSLGCSNREIVEYKALRGVGKASSRVQSWGWATVVQKTIWCL